MTSRLLPLLKEEKIIAIIRGVSQDSIQPIAEALWSGGMKFLEITMNTDRALAAIAKLRETYENRLYIGAGTVLELEMAKEAVRAGAQYIISPHLNEQVVAYCVEQGIDVWPGTMTPSEMYRAYQLGASAVKVFPIGTLGANYIKEVKAPLPFIEMIATGGVNTKNMMTILNNGAIAVGLGGNLVDKQLVQQKNYDELTKRARMFVELAKGVGSDAAK
ncbi:2-dehydro-3-deoxyphosphogluconate aldolase/4-hydroxy-2-oxoglutarate aldolase family protein [Anoxybacillus sp. B7M1]|uniref:bifunctional 4-hydroxy-2-oxoglutarate aldolase/2-dehydro-3-deoxy-phosphogluconate aldolase n=1 Tax=unclassified Anoxybacillus TaxID=2639704 RepID=UPI0005CCFC66|nr:MULTISPECIES: bifunctional 4-hydroxy-2-oxoglutarate aldolase/2-dehydro-3-deoxy-phosphogluconate aldolase [unclassified Anoxybacillus]ANB55627.1 2-dehydro-3-deoxyphosphogluconate aldolase/4-hydroxy-2-oxoglutarate aldolase family protein [Anoxybacillus sp. B2M1]ANB65738.1 2-dehydro-3-deoxyphosphogluconate aldolase/4-hydroxy-2-oxoglutarate aldolase family protein [Anoxybacillus sp. B7M1]